MIQEWLVTFAGDTKIHIALFLIAADFILGVTAALRVGNFRFAYVADFLRNDVIGKLVPYLAFYVLALVAGDIEIVVPGVDFGVLAGVAYAALVVAMGGSILNSANEIRQPAPKLGEGQTLRTALVGDEQA